MQTLQALEVFDEFSPIEDLDAPTARQLIDANRWYQLSNSVNLNRGRREEARGKSASLLDEILHTHPEQPDAINLKGRIALDSGKVSEARDLIEQAIRLYPGKAAFWTNRGFVSLLQSQYDQAESFFTQALAYDKSSVQAFAATALCYYLRGDYVGAFLRYRSLLQKNAINLAGANALLDCCSHLTSDHYDESLEADLHKLFETDDLDHSLLSQLTSSLIIHKFDLTNQDCVLDLDVLAKDPLLSALLAKANLCHPAIEELVALLRQQILIEVTQSGDLREEMQTLAINLGRFIERTDYAVNASAEEMWVVEDIDECIRAACKEQSPTDELTGALIVVSMYKQLYTQNYSYHLLAYDLSDWAAGIQPLLADNLYRKSDLHAIKFGLPHADKDIARSFNSPYLAAAYPRWEVLPYHSTTNYFDVLSKELGEENIPKAWATKEINILIVGCRTGDRAIKLARFFEGTKVTAVDFSADNIAYAIYQANRHHVTNIRFEVLQDAAALASLGQTYEMIEIGEELSDDIEVILRAKSLASTDGLLRFQTCGAAPLAESEILNTLKQTKYLPTSENIRQLRQQILAMPDSPSRDLLIKNKEFYSLGGCYHLLFHTYDNNKAGMSTVWEKTGLGTVAQSKDGNAVYTRQASRFKIRMA